MPPTPIPLVILTALACAACSATAPGRMPQQTPSRQEAQVQAGLPGQVSAADALRGHGDAWERLLAAEDARAATPAQLATLREGLRSDVAELRLMAVRALGRLERPEVAADIAVLLGDGDPRVRAHAANAYAQAARGGAVNRLRLLAALESETDGYALAGMAEAAGRMPHANAEEARRTLELLLPRLSAADVTVQLGAVRGAYFMARQQPLRPAFNGAVLSALRQRATAAGDRTGLAEVRVRTVAAMTVVAAGASDAAFAAALLQDASPAVRREGVLAAAAVQDTAAVQRLLLRSLSDSAQSVRYEALRAYGRRLASTHGCEPVRAAARDAGPHVRMLALELLGSCTGDGDIAYLESRAAEAFTSRWHEGARALVSLAQRAPERARASMRAGDWSRLPVDAFAGPYVVRTYAILRDTSALRRLAQFDDVNVRTAAVQALASLAGRDADFTYLLQLDSNDSQLLQAAANALEGSREARAPAALLDALDRMTQLQWETSRDARRALLRRAGELGGAAYAPRVLPYLRDFDPVIANLAADVLATWTGQRPQPTPSAPPVLALPTFPEAVRLATGVVEIEMADGGLILLRLLPFEAPTNAARFARLAERGFYDGLTLHRVVPNFVVQGGSPHANEYTGDGPFSRDELGLAGNWRGTVGLSTRGRDTGDAQLFINLIDNVRLDHDYTVFAVVVAGMDVVDNMLEGARMRRVRLLP